MTKSTLPPIDKWKNHGTIRDHYQVVRMRADIEINSLDVLFFRKKILSWWRIGGRSFPWRNKGLSNYKKVIAEILLQRTRAESVARFWKTFVCHYPNWKSLSSSSRARIAHLLLPIGLSNEKAPRMKALARAIVRRNGRLPSKREEIEQLPGVGQYIANSVELLCFKRPRPLLDSNMARIIERFVHPRRLRDIRYDGFLQRLSMRLVNSSQSQEINWAILDLAAIYCRIEVPICVECPLLERCNFARNTQDTF